MTIMEHSIRKHAAPVLGVAAFLTWTIRVTEADRQERRNTRRTAERARYARDVAIRARLVAEGKVHG